ncbi:probable RNA-binding protein CG14230 [Chironomus tepperi]|uniref:probable RNA-binding protein CG14230 n=1 Tax=Chironomus tepperi TaxID=113505 RepID=UPI00391F7A42
MTETRFFIGNIPANTVESELESEFGYYGKVKSVELKKKNEESLYGFVNIEIEEKLIPKCIREFGQQQFKGNYLSVSKAKESFLDRLKREREQLDRLADNTIGQKLIEISMKSVAELEQPQEKPELPKIEKEVSSDESSSDEEETITIKQAVKISAFPKRTTFDSFTNYQKEEPKVLDQATLDDMKRQQSLQKLKDMHKNQKDAIKNALSNIDSTIPRSNKIVFEKPEPVVKSVDNSAKKPTLFDEEEYDEEMEVEPESFKIKKQFEGKKGEKLFEIQTKFNNDSRFKMDEKFVDETDEFIDSRKKYSRDELKERKRLRKEMANWDQAEMKEERDHQLSILESITGQPLSSNQQKPQQKGMLRFDPSKKSHQKYLDVVKGDEQIEDDDEEMEVDEDESKPAEKNAEERFYEVSDNLANAFKSKDDSQPFSIFGMLGVKHDDSDDEKPVEVVEEKEIKLAPKMHAFQMNQVRFKYDSSDTDEDAEIEKSKKKAKKEPQKKQSKDGKYTKSGVWRYNFFVCDGDKRLQDAFAFLKKAAFVDPKKMLEERQKLKKVIKNQVRKARHDKEKSFKKRKV